MKITKKQLVKIIKEEKARILAEQSQPTGADFVHVLNAIQAAVNEACEDLGLDEMGAEWIAQKLNPGLPSAAAQRGVEDYLKKLSLTGGKSKPRSV